MSHFPKTSIQTIALEIDGAFDDPIVVWQNFLGIVNRLSGVTVISSIKHDFPGGGFSGLILLGESHAAIHTFPERRAAWVELATCGDPAAIGEFVERLSNIGLSPELVE